MISGALVVIASVVALVMMFQIDARGAQIKAQGARLARTLAALPWEQLGPGAPAHGAFQTLVGLEHSREFAYAVLVDAAGRSITEVATEGAAVPPAAAPGAPSAWFGERTLSLPGTRKKLREFHAPALDQGELKGFVRIGYFPPTYAPSGEQISFLGLVALVVFLLVPGFHLMLRRELKPLEHMGAHLRKLAAQAPGGTLEIAPTTDLRQFMDRFSGFIEDLNARARDIDSQRAAMLTANRLLSYKKDKAETILQVLPEGVMIMDDTGVISFASAKIEALIGVAPEALVGEAPRTWCEDEVLLGFLMRCQNIAAQTTRGDTLLYSPAQSPERTIQVSAIPLASRGEDAMFFGALLVFRDVTAEARSKAAGNEFVAYATHEMKAPLNVLKLYSEVLQGEDAGDETVRVEAVNAIHDQVERMNGILENLRTITMIEMGSLVVERQRVKLHDLLRDTFEAFATGGRVAGLELKLEVPNELTPLALDKGLFTVALNNLLSNAAKYNRPGGTVRLTATEDDDEIVIAVQDTGIGLAAADWERVFEKFYRAQDEETRRREGQGLGLYLARQIVELHQGKLSARGEPGKGATFSIVLAKSATLLRERI